MADASFKLFHVCKEGISMHVKSETNNGGASAMKKDFGRENISRLCIRYITCI